MEGLPLFLNGHPAIGVMQRRSCKGTVRSRSLHSISSTVVRQLSANFRVLGAVEDQAVDAFDNVFLEMLRPGKH